MAAVLGILYVIGVFLVRLIPAVLLIIFGFYIIKKISNYSAPKIPGIMQEFQKRQVLQPQRRLFHVFLLSRYKNGF